MQTFDMLPIKNGLKQGNALFPLIFNFALEYAIRRVQANKEDLKLKVTHQFLVYTDDANILGGSIHTITKCRSLVVANKVNGLEVNAENNKCTIMSWDEHAGKNTT